MRPDIDILTRAERALDALHKDLSIKAQLAGHDRLTGAQILLLARFGDGVHTTQTLTRGSAYIGQSASYNICKLLGAGYLERAEALSSDRRMKPLRLSRRGRELAALAEGWLSELMPPHRRALQQAAA